MNFRSVVAAVCTWNAGTWLNRHLLSRPHAKDVVAQ